MIYSRASTLEGLQIINPFLKDEDQNSENSEIEEVPNLNPIRLQAIAAQLNQLNPIYSR